MLTVLEKTFKVIVIAFGFVEYMDDNILNITQYPFRLPVALDHGFDAMILCYFLDFVGNRLYLPVGSPVTNDIIVGHTARFRHVEFHYIFSTLIITCSDHQ